MTIVPDLLGHSLEYRVPDGAIGSSIRHTVTESGRWLINSITFDYTCDANAGTRLPFLFITPASAIMFHSGLHDKGFGANANISASCFHGTSTFCDTTKHNRCWIQLPRIAQISGTFEISLAATGMQAGDQIKNIYIFASFWQEH